METIRGKTSHAMDLTELHARLANHNRLMLDLGTGDGKFALCHAENFPSHFVIGVDSCRENLHECSRKGLPNLLYIIANAQSLPHELCGLFSHVTINFPWGSLLQGLLAGDSRLLCGLESVLGSGAQLEVRLNGGALSEAGWDFANGTEQVCQSLTRTGWNICSQREMNAGALRTFPSTWAKRLAFGRDPHAVEIRATFNA